MSTPDSQHPATESPSARPPAVGRAAHRRTARHRVAGILGATALGLGGLAYAATAGGSSTATTTRQVSPDLQQQAPTQQDPSGPGAQTRPFDPGSSSSSTAEDEATDATSAQESGLVYITTTLDYGSGKAAGTGMVLTPDGEVLTNHHVIEGATSISVQDVATGTTYDAEVVGYDSTHDVAVLQLQDASGLATVTTDPAGTVQVGDRVTGVGNANGDGGAASAAAGTVTALDQSITVSSDSGGAAEQLSDLVEIDADIIAGDSGGALYDSDGEVVGMDTAASSGAADVTGYAIPIAEALSIAGRITAGDDTGSVQTGGTGFLGVELSPQDGSGSATIAGTVDGSPAAGAGIGAGSVVTSVDGQTITSAEQLSSAVATLAPGRSVLVGWTDASGSTHTASVTLTQGPVG